MGVGGVSLLSWAVAYTDQCFSWKCDHFWESHWSQKLEGGDQGKGSVVALAVVKMKEDFFCFFITASVRLLPMHHLIVGCDQTFPCCVTCQFYYCIGKVSCCAAGVWGCSPGVHQWWETVGWVKSVNEAAETMVEEFLHQILGQHCVQCRAVQMLLCIFKQAYD